MAPDSADAAVDGDADVEAGDVAAGDDSLTFFERVLPDSALGRWGIYLVIVAVVAAVLWFWVFPWLQNLLPPGF